MPKLLSTAALVLTILLPRVASAQWIYASVGASFVHETSKSSTSGSANLAGLMVEAGIRLGQNVGVGVALESDRFTTSTETFYQRSAVGSLEFHTASRRSRLLPFVHFRAGLYDLLGYSESKGRDVMAIAGGGVDVVISNVFALRSSADLRFFPRHESSGLRQVVLGIGVVAKPF